MNLVDCHAHLEELEDPEAAVRRAGESGVAFIVAVGLDGESSRRVLELSGRHGDATVVPALGIHPWRVRSVNLEEDIAFVEENLGRAVALGEVGLDFWLKEARKDPSHREEQVRVFRRLLSHAGEHSEPADVLKALRAVAGIKQVAEAEVAEVTAANAAGFFDLPGKMPVDTRRWRE